MGGHVLPKFDVRACVCFRRQRTSERTRDIARKMTDRIDNDDESLIPLRLFGESDPRLRHVDQQQLFGRCWDYLGNGNAPGGVFPVPGGQLV